MEPSPKLKPQFRVIKSDTKKRKIPPTTAFIVIAEDGDFYIDIEEHTCQEVDKWKYS